MELIKYNITDSAIAKMESEYMGLVVQGLDDEAGFKMVHQARMVVKGHRVAVEKRRKELKSDALEYGRKVDSEARKIMGKLEPIESHLQAEEDKVTKEQERIRQAKIEAEQKRIEKIRQLIDSIKAFSNIDLMLPSIKIKKTLATVDSLLISEETFMEFTDEARSEFVNTKNKVEAALNKRLAYEDEQAKAKSEAERLEAIRKEQEAEAAKQAEERRKIEEAQRKIETEKARIEAEKKAEQERKDREEFERKAEEVARIQAEKEAKEKVEREARERKEREEAEAKEKARQEALRPDKDKMLNYAAMIASVDNMPVLTHKKAIDILGRYMRKIITATAEFKAEAEAL